MLDIYNHPVNNVGLDPMQGFDVAAWMQDAASGQLAFFGDFQSITLTIRDSTETYLPLGTRFPVYLNGEVQIAFVIEQGMVDMNFLQRTFGIQNMSREQLVTRGPRFQLTWDVSAYDLAQNYNGIVGAGTPQAGSVNTNSNYSIYRTGGTSFNQIVGGDNNSYVSNKLTGLAGAAPASYNKPIPLAQGRYELQRCKIDSLSVGIMPGRRVIAQRWEGVAEGIRFIPETLQNFRNNAGGPSFNGSNTLSTGDPNGIPGGVKGAPIRAQIF